MRHKGGGNVTSAFLRLAFTAASALAACLFLTRAAALGAEGGFVHPGDAATFVDPRTGTEMKVLIDGKTVGTTKLSVAELTIPAGTSVPAHTHKSIEVFYIISGELEQTIRGESKRLTAGMSCLVPADTDTLHKVTSKEPVRTLVVWVPGGEEARIAVDWKPVGSR